MKFLSLIYIFGAIVSPTIAHTDPSVNGAVDAIDQDMSGAPTEMLARRPVRHYFPLALQSLPLLWFLSCPTQYRMPLSILDGTLDTCD
ncbi:hypothetical protein E4U17_005887 [Claviceps sp. LM77 group G4]|nr:hypothetical protein E4U17_005887 [Claviceps sp. LM77 group G4]